MNRVGVKVRREIVPSAGYDVTVVEGYRVPVESREEVRGRGPRPDRVGRTLRTSSPVEGREMTQWVARDGRMDVKVVPVLRLTRGRRGSHGACPDPCDVRGLYIHPQLNNV